MVATMTKPYLKLSTSRKVALWQKKRKTGDRYDTLPNTIALEPYKTCPGYTTGPLGCKGVCYPMDHQYPSVTELWDHNWDAIHAAYTDGGVTAVAQLLIDAVLDAERQHERKGVEMDIFRLHEAGDFFSDWYAEAWACACRSLPHITFWAYTRSFHLVPLLTGIPNLKLYLSVDPENVDEASETYTDDLAGVAVMTRSESYGRETAVALTGRKATVCPVESSRPRLDLTVQVEDRIYQGACAKCRICTRGTRNVVFRIRKG